MKWKNFLIGEVHWYSSKCFCTDARSCGFRFAITYGAYLCWLFIGYDHNDVDLRAALANIRMDMNGMRDNFEDAVSHMLPVDPYTKSKK